jgi:hypothetical protein
MWGSELKHQYCKDNNNKKYLEQEVRLLHISKSLDLCVWYNINIARTLQGT